MGNGSGVINHSDRSTSYSATAARSARVNGLNECWDRMDGARDGMVRTCAAGLMVTWDGDEGESERRPCDGERDCDGDRVILRVASCRRVRIVGESTAC